MKVAVNLLLILTLCLCGCGTKAKTQTEPETGEEYKAYGIEEIMLPAADAEMDKLLSDEQTYTGGEYMLYGGSVYRVVQVYDKESDTKVSYLQCLSEPYESWETKVIAACQIEGREHVVERLYFGNDMPAYCMLASSDGKEIKRYFARFVDGAVGEVLCAIPDDLNIGYGTELEIGADEEIYTYVRSGSKLVVRDEELKNKREWELSGRIWGIPENAVCEEKCWFGATDEGIGIFNVNGEVLVNGPENVVSNYFHMDINEAGKVYLADNNAVWCCEEQPVKICDFIDSGYLLQSLSGVETQEDGSVLALVTEDGRNSLLLLREKKEDGEAAVQVKQGKQEIILSMDEEQDGLKKAVARYNRQSENYRITIALPKKENFFEYWERIKLELSAGKGPDILAGSFYTEMPEPAAVISGGIRNGYFESLEDVLDETEAYLQAALEGGRVNGKLYGIPYDCRFIVNAYTKDFAGDRTALSVSELIRSIEESEAEVAQCQYDAMDIVLWYGLYDNSSALYVDWENKESHLTEEPFLKLLEFAKNYGDKEGWNGGLQDESVQMISLGKSVAHRSDLHGVNDLHQVYACLRGEPYVLGFPREEGYGFYVKSKYLYMNSTSTYKEGVKDFLRFLISEEEQNKIFMQEISSDANLTGATAYLPVNRKTWDELILTAKNDHTLHTCMPGDYEYEYRGLTDEQVELWYFILEHAHPDNFYAKDIEAIVEEELTPYFAGEKTAEEAVRILDNRIQLFLEENE
ncbi:MAG: ABC transporter substrate-binding protein [Lachnospiraceae bacterium]|nr:ABC transporter substrate-binding protein [Lachnospiraceae bacterium]